MTFVITESILEEDKMSTLQIINIVISFRTSMRLHEADNVSKFREKGWHFYQNSSTPINDAFVLVRDNNNVNFNTNTNARSYLLTIDS